MRTKQKPSKAARREGWIAFGFLLPNLLGFLVFTFLPVVVGLVLSLTNYDGFGQMEFTGLKNFTRLFQDDYFYTALKNNIYYTVLSVSLTLIIALALAVLLQQKLKGSEIFKTIFFFPQLTSSVAFGIIFMALFRGEGPVNGVLEWLASVAHLHGMVYDDDCDRIGNKKFWLLHGFVYRRSAGDSGGFVRSSISGWGEYVEKIQIHHAAHAFAYNVPVYSHVSDKFLQGI